MTAKSHKGLSDFEWKTRLQQYAAGKFKFGKGEKPCRPDRLSALAKVDKCEVFIGFAPMFSNRLPICTCGHHSALTAHQSTSSSSSSSSSSSAAEKGAYYSACLYYGDLYHANK